MTESLPPLPSSSEPLVYQPFSGWAIAGLAVGGFFALLVALSAVVAFYQGMPFFYPIWIMGLPILGVAVSLFGQRHVQSSEGTRIGAKQARWGFWLSLVSGLMYSSYYFVTEFALQSQANTFAMEKSEDAGFFPRLRAGADDSIELNRAFLLTQPPSARTGRAENEKSMREFHDISGKDGASGLLTQFREGELLPRIFFKQLAKDAEITHLAMQDWKLEKRSYMVYHAYRITTKELELDYLLAIFSAEAETAGQGRKWFVNLRESRPMGPPKLTPIGQGMAKLRKRAGDWVTQYFQKLNEGVPLADIKNIDQTPWEVLAPHDGKFLERRNQLHQVFAAAGLQRLPGFSVATPPEAPGKWEQVEGRIRIYHTFRIVIPGAQAQPPTFQVEGVAALETKQIIDPAQFTDDARTDWSLISLVFTSVTPPASEKKEPANPKGAAN